MNDVAAARRPAESGCGLPEVNGKFNKTQIDIRTELQQFLYRYEDKPDRKLIERKLDLGPWTKRGELNFEKIV
ncbi:hypothetical protein J6590_103361 [Homalodisca vitripennis]|nr:hypothetical protein J6590_103361 [Homalodisca vitripennis]